MSPQGCISWPRLRELLLSTVPRFHQPGSYAGTENSHGQSQPQDTMRAGLNKSRHGEVIRKRWWEWAREVTVASPGWGLAWL